jgi:hypothetical protein
MNQYENKLIKDIEKKCTTIMIGSIARFEKMFGYLWEDDTEQSDKYYDMWQHARQDILNFGNHHIREAIENLYKHFMNNKDNKEYSYEFRFKNDQNQEKK